MGSFWKDGIRGFYQYQPFCWNFIKVFRTYHKLGHFQGKRSLNKRRDFSVYVLKIHAQEWRHARGILEYANQSGPIGTFTDVANFNEIDNFSDVESANLTMSRSRPFQPFNNSVRSSKTKWVATNMHFDMHVAETHIFLIFFYM